ncbi:hypothetical protein JX265_004999 [Neoarthrinium moseri]|uniref:Uncharacterized protein n=1 Tax=Neoarthrinium moseri TaxID=1658444 RepID=A0A9P9WP03_9PEZI|nr:hypothetical protein JX265_004999 [Neoarthrinium moseri]
MAYKYLTDPSYTGPPWDADWPRYPVQTFWESTVTAAAANHGSPQPFSIVPVVKSSTHDQEERDRNQPREYEWASKQAFWYNALDQTLAELSRSEHVARQTAGEDAAAKKTNKARRMIVALVHGVRQHVVRVLVSALYTAFDGFGEKIGSILAWLRHLYVWAAMVLLVVSVACCLIQCWWTGKTKYSGASLLEPLDETVEITFVAMPCLRAWSVA